MAEDAPKLPEDELLGLAELVRSTLPWEPNPEWFSRVREKLMSAELPEHDGPAL